MIMLLSVLFLACYCSGGGGGSSSLTGSSSASSAAAEAVTFVSIAVTPANPSISATGQFAAFGMYSDGTRFPITTQVTWSSSNPLFGDNEQQPLGQ